MTTPKLANKVVLLTVLCQGQLQRIDSALAGKKAQLTVRACAPRRLGMGVELVEAIARQVMPDSSHSSRWNL